MSCRRHRTSVQRPMKHCSHLVLRIIITFHNHALLLYHIHYIININYRVFSNKDACRISSEFIINALMKLLHYFHTTYLLLPTSCRKNDENSLFQNLHQRFSFQQNKIWSQGFYPDKSRKYLPETIRKQC